MQHLFSYYLFPLCFFVFASDSCVVFTQTEIRPCLQYIDEPFFINPNFMRCASMIVQQRAASETVRRQLQLFLTCDTFHATVLVFRDSGL